MIIYEIEAKIEEGLAGSFEIYMNERHIRDLLETDFFESAEMTEASVGVYRIKYRCQSRHILDEYFATRADELRQDFISHFPSGVELRRRIYERD